MQPFDSVNSNELMQYAVDFNESRIIGLIFISDDHIHAEQIFNHPRLIASVTYKEAEMLEQYTYSAKNGDNFYTAQMIHTYTSRCEHVMNAMIIQIILTLVYFFTSVAWLYKIC